MERDIYTDPRVGDRVQVVPAVCNRLPEPLIVISVDKNRIHWSRPVCGQKGACTWGVWQQTGASCGNGGKRLKLLTANPKESDEQYDMFGGVA